MTDEDHFQTEIDKRPADPLPRQVFADWLEERGDPRAAGYRAMGECGLNGCHCSVRRDVVTDWLPNGRTRWHSYPHGSTRLWLPGPWFHATYKSHPAKDSYVRTGIFLNRRAAEDAAALAWLELTPEEREQCYRECGVIPSGQPAGAV